MLTVTGKVIITYARIYGFAVPSKVFKVYLGMLQNGYINWQSDYHQCKNLLWFSWKSSSTEEFLEGKYCL
jgi:hypothetical protein